MTVQVFVTVGTSALSKFRPSRWTKSEGDLIKELNRGDRDVFDSRKKEMVEVATYLMTHYDSGSESTNLHKYSAELGSLLAMQRRGDMFDSDPAKNRIYLLHTDTMEGRLCAEVNAASITASSVFASFVSTIEVRKIEHLSVEHAQQFGEGLQAFKSLVAEQCLNQPGDRRIFNITGGYKALIPYATVLAWDQCMTICYLYEGSNELIVMKGPTNWLPIFDEITPPAKSPDLMPPER